MEARVGVVRRALQLLAHVLLREDELPILRVEIILGDDHLLREVENGRQRAAAREPALGGEPALRAERLVLLGLRGWLGELELDHVEAPPVERVELQRVDSRGADGDAINEHGHRSVPRTSASNISTTALAIFGPSTFPGIAFGM